ncbi:uncharacterized protein N7498_004503 [Penicillium cinerascens]|uniref:Phosphoglycerate mutase family protein n=1 Tax=Penicillium cinerascens TaxID=70096 RepID=A0A9W9MLP0_9EURO|nr:uncharacterized protein N7498_004503 [Penicillium cinerascens]KAJ5203624.1 hypothetical protein N7498_004503 [Penicillium cinerascens]
MYRYMLSPFFAAMAAVTVVTARPTVYFIRHGEKPKDGGTGLSADGLERAQCIRSVFIRNPLYNVKVRVLTARHHADGKRARPYETVKLLASDLSLEVDISCQRNDYKCVTDAIEGYHGEGNILICWEHHRMTHIIEDLGDHDAPVYPDDRFDLIWSDPSPYNKISDETSERCPGLDNYSDLFVFQEI